MRRFILIQAWKIRREKSSNDLRQWNYPDVIPCRTVVESQGRMGLLTGLECFIVLHPQWISPSPCPGEPDYCLFLGCRSSYYWHFTLLYFSWTEGPTCIQLRQQYPQQSVLCNCYHFILWYCKLRGLFISELGVCSVLWCANWVSSDVRTAGFVVITENHWKITQQNLCVICPLILSTF